MFRKAFKDVEDSSPRGHIPSQPPSHLQALSGACCGQLTGDVGQSDVQGVVAGVAACSAFKPSSKPSPTPTNAESIILAGGYFGGRAGRVGQSWKGSRGGEGAMAIDEKGLSAQN